MVPHMINEQNIWKLVCIHFFNVQRIELNDIFVIREIININICITTC